MGEKQLRQLAKAVRITAAQKTAYEKVAGIFHRTVNANEREEISERMNLQEAKSSVKIEHP